MKQNKKLADKPSEKQLNDAIKQDMNENKKLDPEGEAYNP